MSTSAEIVAWTCFVVGVALLLAGVLIGLRLTFRKAVADVEEKVAALHDKIDDMKEAGVDGSLKATRDEDAATTVTMKAADVKSTLEEVSGIIAALPENLRFAGLLVLVGAVLMSVATVQFGGHSIF